MPLFFIIAIAAGGLTVGAVTADVTTDIRAQQAQQIQAQQVPQAVQQGQQVVAFYPNAYASLADCQAAAQRMNIPLSACAGR